MSSSGPSHGKIETVEADSTVAERSNDKMNDAPPKPIISDINQCQTELVALLENLWKETVKVKTKYEKLQKPYYDKRAVMIEKIPKFWVKAIINHPHISFVAGEQDILHFLNKLEVEDFETENCCDYAFCFKFIFDENPFFENTELVKEYLFLENKKPKSTSTPIKWKEGMDFSKKPPLVIDRKRGLEQKTFFSWFIDNSDPEIDNIYDTIRKDLWTNPQQYYIQNKPGNPKHDDRSVGNGKCDT